MKMTEEQLKALITSQVEAALVAQGKALTDGLQDTVKNVVQDVLKQKINVKDLIIQDPDLKPETEDPKAGYKCFSEFAMNVRDAAVSNGRNIDKRLEALDVKSIVTKAAGTGLVEGDVEYGGYLIPEEFRNNILEVAVERSNILNMAMMIPMATNVINIPYISGFDRSSGTLHGGIEFKWLDEAGQKNEARPEFGKIQLRLRKIAGLAYATDEIMEDSPISLEPILTRMFTEALAWQMDNVFINGTGAGKPLGVINAPCLISVDKEAGQDATTIVSEETLYSVMSIEEPRELMGTPNFKYAYAS